MAQSHFSLSWEGYKKNVCSGLSILQQNGELVDMTLAADGHFVKVHQVVMALASPYIKELITSTQCQHPVIFLNKISYTTLCYMLEYVYTGEVLVTIENLNELIQAGRELHIKGLEDMNLPHAAPSQKLPQNIHNEKENMDDEICYFEITNPNEDDDKPGYTDKIRIYEERDIISETIEGADDETMQDVIGTQAIIVKDEDEIEMHKQKFYNKCDNSNVGLIQYTVSNQGSLQMILNRFIYYLKHTNRNNSRQWRCVDYLSNLKCPALVVTKDDIVVQRISAHNHPFHDKKILKKVKAGAIFSAIQEAEREGNSKKNNKAAIDEISHGDTD